MLNSRLGFLLSALLLALPSFAHQSSTISGTVVGSSGQPMSMAHVRLAGGTAHTELITDLADREFAAVQVRPDGSFTLVTDSLGALMLMVTGVGHTMLRIPLVLDQPAMLPHAEVNRAMA